MPACNRTHPWERGVPVTGSNSCKAIARSGTNSVQKLIPLWLRTRFRTGKPVDSVIGVQLLPFTLEPLAEQATPSGDAGSTQQWPFPVEHISDSIESSLQWSV